MHRLLAIALVLLAAALPASAQPYPGKPVRVVVAFSPGTTSDIIGRMVAERLTQLMGQPFVVENRTGAGGTIGAEFVAKAAPDGYTLLVSTAALPVTASVYKSLNYDTAKDFAGIITISHSPLALAANLEFPPKTVPELIAYGKANPGKVNFGSAGVGTSHHLTGEKFKLEAGIDMQHVPYRGSGPAHLDLMAGQIQLMFDNVVALAPHFKSGKLRPLAVSSAKRNHMLPDVPSLAEAGLPGFDSVAWFGFAAPAGTPLPVIDQLNAAIKKVLEMPDVRQRLVDSGSDVIGDTPDAATRHIRAEVAKWASVVKAANVTAE